MFKLEDDLFFKFFFWSIFFHLYDKYKFLTNIIQSNINLYQYNLKWAECCHGVDMQYKTHFMYSDSLSFNVLFRVDSKALLLDGSSLYFLCRSSLIFILKVWISFSIRDFWLLVNFEVSLLLILYQSHNKTNTNKL